MQTLAELGEVSKAFIVNGRGKAVPVARFYGNKANTRATNIISAEAKNRREWLPDLPSLKEDDFPMEAPTKWYRDLRGRRMHREADDARKSAVSVRRPYESVIRHVDNLDSKARRQGNQFQGLNYSQKQEDANQHLLGSAVGNRMSWNDWQTEADRLRSSRNIASAAEQRALKRMSRADRRNRNVDRAINTGLGTAGAGALGGAGYGGYRTWKKYGSNQNRQTNDLPNSERNEIDRRVANANAWRDADQWRRAR